jgi:circadian clock protein KaiB
MCSEPKRDVAPSAGDPGLDADAQATLEQFEKLVAELAQPHYLFRLFVSGSSDRSATAITNVRSICDKYLPGRYQLEVVDVYQQPSETKKAHVIAVPTLIKELPFPPQRFIGDMSNMDRIVVGLKLER